MPNTIEKARDLPAVRPATTATLDADVILPWASIVIEGILVALPYVVAVTPVGCNWEAIILPVIFEFATVAEIATLEALVILPYVSTVKEGIRVALPYVAADAPEVANLVTLKVPVLKLLTLEAYTTVASSEPPAVEPS